MTEKPITAAAAAVAVGKFEAMAYFGQVGEGGRTAIIDSLLRIVNSPCKEHSRSGMPCECERPILRNLAGVAIKTPPSERLRQFLEGFLRVPGGWPGLGEMESVYNLLFPCGDGIERSHPRISGLTLEDSEIGSYTSLLPPVPEPAWKSLPAPLGEFGSEEERQAEARKFVATLTAQMTGNEDFK